MTSTIEIMSEADIARECRRDPEQGFGALRTERGALPLEAMRVEAKIDGLVAHTTIHQTFINSSKQSAQRAERAEAGARASPERDPQDGAPMEATYIFPLPDRAAVTSFRMEIAGRIINGIIEERGQARERYDRAIQEGHRAAITEEERPGVFTMRVGNIMPNERATVRLTMTGPLPYDEGEATFRFPLVVAPRYIPGVPLGGGDVGLGTALDTDAVPDASRISPPVLLPGFPNPVRLELRAELRDARLPLTNLRSSLHAIVESSSNGARTIEIRPGERLDRDFILRWKLAENEVRTSLLLKPDQIGNEGTFLLTVVPPASLSRAMKPRDIVFVLDRSGSMSGWKMVAARRAVGRMVDTLRDRDRFTVCAFDDSIETPTDFGMSLADATDRNRFRAVEWLAGIDSRGGTEMAAPLQQAASQLAGGYADRERAIVLVTDGQVGNEDQILRMLGANLKNVRVFCVGIDQAVNAAFLKRLADLGGGLSELVESEDRLDEVMDRIHRRIGTPLLTELSLRGHDLDVDARAIAPNRLPDLFAGAPVVIGGRYRGRAVGALHLAGVDASGRSWSETVQGQVSNSEAIASVWARARVRDLEDRFVLTRDSTLEREIVSTSIRFSVLCRFTAFVAVDEAERVNPGGHLHEVVQPIDAPAGWDMFGGRAAPAPGGGGPFRAKAKAGKSGPFIGNSMARRRESYDEMDDEAPQEQTRGIVFDVMARRAATPKPSPAPKQVRDSYAKGAFTGKSSISIPALVEVVRKESDPRLAAQLLVKELPEVIDQVRAIGADANLIRELEDLLVKMADPNAAADDLAKYVARTLELLDPHSRSRGAFWR